MFAASLFLAALPAGVQADLRVGEPVPIPGEVAVESIACGDEVCLVAGTWTMFYYETSRATLIRIDDFSVVATYELPFFDPTVAVAGDTFLVAGIEVRQLVGLRIPASGGAPLDAEPFEIATNAGPYPDRIAEARAASNGAEFMVAYTRHWATLEYADFYVPNADVEVARVTRAGVVLDPDGRAVSTALGPQGNPAIGWNGEQYVVTYLSAGALKSRRVGTDGRPTGLSSTRRRTRTIGSWSA